MDPVRPGVIEALKSWKKALDRTLAYLERLETALFDAAIMDIVVAELFQLPVEDNKVVVLAKFQPKSTTSCTFDINFELTEVTLESINKLQDLAGAVNLLYEVAEVVHQEEGQSVRMEERNLFWEVAKKDLILSEDKRTATRQSNNTHKNCQVVGSEGWSFGVHTWKLRLNGVGGNTNSRRIYWIVFGVATESHKHNPVDGYHVEGQTFGHCTWNGSEYFSLGKVSGGVTPVAPDSVVTLTLDCDNRTLSFSQNNVEYLKINVPKHTKLYPWAHLHVLNNSVSFE